MMIPAFQCFALACLLCLIVPITSSETTGRAVPPPHSPLPGAALAQAADGSELPTSSSNRNLNGICRPIPGPGGEPIHLIPITVTNLLGIPGNPKQMICQLPKLSSNRPSSHALSPPLLTASLSSTGRSPGATASTLDGVGMTDSIQQQSAASKPASESSSLATTFPDISTPALGVTTHPPAAEQSVTGNSTLSSTSPIATYPPTSLGLGTSASPSSPLQPAGTGTSSLISPTPLATSPSLSKHSTTGSTTEELSSHRYSSPPSLPLTATLSSTARLPGATASTPDAVAITDNIQQQSAASKPASESSSLATTFPDISTPASGVTTHPPAEQSVTGNSTLSSTSPIANSPTTALGLGTAASPSSPLQPGGKENSSLVSPKPLGTSPPRTKKFTVGSTIEAWYRFENSTTDSSSKHHSYGEIHGSISYEGGVCGQAVAFGGRSMITVPSLAKVEWGTQFSVSLWFQLPMEWKENIMGILDSWNTAIHYIPSSKTMEGCIVTAPPKDIYLWRLCHSIGIEYKEEEWNHLAMTFNGREIVMYLNGNGHGQSYDKEGPIAHTTQHLTIGISTYYFYKYYESYYLYGLIDEIQMYHHVISASEVNELFQSPCS